VSGTAEQVLDAHGFTGERLLKLCRKSQTTSSPAAVGSCTSSVSRALVGYLALQGVQAALRYDPERTHAKYGQNGGDPFASWLADILDHRVTDWYRSKQEGNGDRRYNLDNRIVLAGDKIEDDPDPDAAFERELALRRAEQGVDFEEAEADLGHGLGDEARLGLHYARLRAEGYRIPNARSSDDGRGTSRRSSRTR
jgi:hypothetical protein